MADEWDQFSVVEPEEDDWNQFTPLPTKPVLGGALIGKEPKFVEVGSKYGVDPSLLMAMSMFETGNGTSRMVNRQNNVAGITNPGGKSYRTFETVDDSIDYMASNLKRNYIDKGITSIESIAAKYAPVGASNDPNSTNDQWPRAVRANLEKLGGIEEQSPDEAIREATEQVRAGRQLVAGQPEPEALPEVKEAIGQVRRGRELLAGEPQQEIPQDWNQFAAVDEIAVQPPEGDWNQFEAINQPPAQDSMVGRVIAKMKTQSPEWMRNTEGAISDIAKGIPGFVASLPRYALEGMKFAAMPEERGNVIREALKEALPMGEQMAQDLSAPVGSREWIRGIIQSAMFAAPGAVLFR
jgi:hypothetical protein